MASVALTKGALWMQNVDYPASYDRALIDALYIAEGVIDGFVVTPDGGLDIAVTGGRAIIQGDEVAGQGKYLIDQDATVTLTLASVGENRVEYVYIAVNDTAVAGGRVGDNVTIETSTTAPPDSALLIATLGLPLGTATITSGMITDNRVITSAVADSTVTTAKIADGAVTTPKIANDAVTTPKIASAAVTEIKIDVGAVSVTKLASNAVTTPKIADGAVTLAKLEATLQATLAAIDPADSIIMIGGSTAPAGWALCDGGAYSRTTYAATFARIGTTFGIGNGSTTFNVPDMRNRFPVGKGPATWSDVVGEGNDPSAKDAVSVYHNHSASGSQDAHSHTAGTLYAVLGGDHNHGVPHGTLLDYYEPGGTEFNYAASPGPYEYRGQPRANVAHFNSGNHTHDVEGTTDGASANGVYVSVNYDGVSGVDRNLPPYRVLNFCIRLR